MENKKVVTLLHIASVTYFIFASFFFLTCFNRNILSKFNKRKFKRDKKTKKKIIIGGFINNNI